MVWTGVIVSHRSSVRLVRLASQTSWRFDSVVGSFRWISFRQKARLVSCKSDGLLKMIGKIEWKKRRK